MKQVTAVAKMLSVIVILFAGTGNAQLTTSDGSYFGLGSKTVSGGITIGQLGLYAALDVAILDVVSIGAAGGFNRSEEIGYWYRNFPALGRVALHPLNFSFLADVLLIRESIDLYGGVAAGYVLTISSWHGVSGQIGTPDKSRITIGPLIGLRVRFNDRWSLFAETCGIIAKFALGAGISL